MGVVLVLCMLLALGLVIFLVFTLVNSVGVKPTKTALTVVEAKQVVPAYTTVQLVGKVPVTIYHPETYHLHFKIDGKAVTSAVNKKFFSFAKVGDQIEVDYGFGRLDNSYLPVNITVVRENESPLPDVQEQ